MRNRIIKRLLFCSSLVICTGIQLGCFSAVVYSDLDYSLPVVFSAVERAMTMGVQKRSDNHREFYSRPFVVKISEELKKQGIYKRGFAKITVLGDRRPYDINADVWIEVASMPKGKKPSELDFHFDRSDKDLARQLLTNIVSSLERQNRDRNLIDDFKPF